MWIQYPVFPAPLVEAGFPGGVLVMNPPCKAGAAGDAGSIPRLERSPGGGNGNPLQYSHLENPMDRGAWRATVRGVTQRWTRLSLHMTANLLTRTVLSPLSGLGTPVEDHLTTYVKVETKPFWKTRSLTERASLSSSWSSCGSVPRDRGKRSPGRWTSLVASPFSRPL